MQLVLLGTAGYHPNDRRHTACLFLPEVGVMLDAGTGAYRLRDRLQTDHLDVFLTHAHLDHVAGLTYLLGILHGRNVRLVIHGEREKLAAIQQHLLSTFIFPVSLPGEFRPLIGAADLPGGGRLTTFPLVHPGGSLGFRLDWPGHSCAYVTDTIAAADAAYVQHLRGVDLLIHECNFGDEKAEFARLTGHSHTSPVAGLARAAGVRRLVLTHFDPADDRADPIGLDDARRIFAATELGEDLMELEF